MRKIDKDAWKELLPDYLKDATNVYRTKHYIVKQVLSMRFDNWSYQTLVSFDTFYLRTEERDLEYNHYLKFRKIRDGRRIKTSTRHGAKCYFRVCFRQAKSQ